MQSNRSAPPENPSPLIRISPKGEPGELRPDHRSFRAGYQTGVRISRMKGTAERQVLPPAFMRGEGHAVAGGVPRSGGESLLSHGFAVPAPPEGKPRGLLPDHRSFRAGYQTGVRIPRLNGTVCRFAPQIPPVKNVFRNRKYLLSPGGCDMIYFIIVKCP